MYTLLAAYMDSISLPLWTCVRTYMTVLHCNIHTCSHACDVLMFASSVCFYVGLTSSAVLLSNNETQIVAFYVY